MIKSAKYSVYPFNFREPITDLWVHWS